ncbi:ATP-binding protein [Thermodesulfatator autotrophicus]|uniref:histidine kinase n=1 Tax=Thermodesulfatator autotrophicus TaxID=1795632 RepID=A0A177E7L8_9BACT|nr:ATP-binding protein [Thermodesulfatator autotrophicus]OAG27885.1 hypothetical protein TH606_04440 [Thermodesulfatator autotrophicus]
MKKFNSLYFRFTGLIILSIIATATIISLSYIYINKKNFWKNQISILQGIRYSLKENIKYFLPLNQKEAIKKLFKNYIGISNIENIALIRDDDKKILISIKPISNPKPLFFCQKGKIAKHEDHFYYRITFEITTPQKRDIEELIFLEKKKNNQSKQKYHLCFILSAKKINNQLWKPIKNSILISLIITIIITILSLLMTKRITAPLKEVTKQIIAISQGKIDKIEPKLVKSEIKEIQKLANAFNQLVEALKNKEIEVRKEIEGYIQELQKKNEELQKTVKELKESQEQLIQTEKLAGLGFIVAGIAHEINNPLQIINGYCEILLAKETDNKKINSLIKVKESVERIRKITESLGEYTRKEKDLKEINLYEVVNKAKETVKLSEKLKDINFNIKISKNITIVGRKTELQQVFINLFLNAIQAMKGKGTIYVEAKEDKKNKFVYIYVKDTGPGIPPEHRKYIFDPFFTTKDPGEGTGLGLNIVYRIITKYNGFIRVLDNDPGAVFEIILKTI